MTTRRLLSGGVPALVVALWTPAAFAQGDGPRMHWKELLALWDEYVKTNNVIIPNRHLFESLEDVLPVRVPVNEGWPPMNSERPFVPPKELVSEESER